MEVALIPVRVPFGHSGLEGSTRPLDYCGLFWLLTLLRSLSSSSIDLCVSDCFPTTVSPGFSVLHLGFDDLGREGLCWLLTKLGQGQDMFCVVSCSVT